MNFTEQFFTQTQKNNLIKKSDRILVAFSGGKDSVCLLFLLHTLQKRFQIEVGACHIHHGIRGEEADRDRDFCRDFCLERGIPFFERRVDAPIFCEKEGLGLEEGARILRYRALKEVAEKEGYHKIATAHTASDQAETVLFRLIRGSGFSGTGGIPAARENIIRPLLPFFESEIRSFLTSLHLLFKEDSSNCDTLFSRNRIRRDILPKMEMINPGTQEALIRFGTLSLWQEDLIKALCDRWEAANGICRDTSSIPLSAVSSLLESPAGYPILYEALSRVAKKEKIVIDFERFTALLSLLKEAKEGKIIEISHGFGFRIQKGELCFEKNEKKPFRIQYQVKLHPGENILPETGTLLTLSDKKRGKVENINKKLLIIHAAFDRIEGDLFARCRAQGDSIRINGMTKSVKKLFQEAGIHEKDRDRIPLICDEEGIVWIPFIGLCDRLRESKSGEIFTMTLEGDLLSEIEKRIERK